MHVLIDQCVAGDKDAWADLWDIYQQVAHRYVRWVIKRAHFCGADADDVAIEIFEHLSEKDCQHLRSFGGTADQFGKWLIHLSINQALNWLDTERRRIRRQDESHANYPMDAHDGPTLEEVLSLIEELKSILRPEDMKHLYEMVGLPDVPTEVESSTPHGESSVAPRTQRLWRRHLEEKLRRAWGFVRGKAKSEEKHPDK